MASKKGGWVLVDCVEGKLQPHANYDREMLDGLQNGETIRIQISRYRSQPRHRLYWVILRQVVKNTNFFTSEKNLHHTLLVGCGVVEPVMSPDGDITFMPSSTAFDAMDEDDFKPYFDRAMEIITTKIMPGVDLDLLLKESKAEANWKDAA